MHLTEQLDRLIDYLANLAPEYTFFNNHANLQGLFAVVLVCLICGCVGSLVVGNRMAFFSDALAHCAFAGVGLGLLVGLFFGLLGSESFYREWGISLIMVVFGVVVGIGIAYVREKTALSSDTVIGVFFAGAIGFGAMLSKALNSRSYLTPESFMFGDPTYVTTQELLLLLALAVVTALVLSWIYNSLIFTSFNSSLARSRQISLRLCAYLFIVLLALIVNLCLKTVGALLINALLIVPAATAANLCRNMRQMFWTTIALSLVAGIGGPWLSWDFPIRNPSGGAPIHFGWGGTIVVLSVIFFFLSMAVGPWLRSRQAPVPA